MRSLLTTLKKIFFWKYARNTWQWDVLCVVILIFIFLTPKHWFSSERRQSKGHQNSVARTLVLAPEVIGNEADRVQIEKQVRILTGRPDAEVLAVRRVVTPDGKTISFEVDIR